MEDVVHPFGRTHNHEAVKTDSPASQRQLWLVAYLRMRKITQDEGRTKREGRGKRFGVGGQTRPMNRIGRCQGTDYPADQYYHAQLSGDMGMAAKVVIRWLGQISTPRSSRREMRFACNGAHGTMRAESRTGTAGSAAKTWHTLVPMPFLFLLHPPMICAYLVFLRYQSVRR
ncbi:hypothetical protein LZ31DRAFT_576719 [Colletotrichum somersetense]|nr:hypothetical protein LZ31DRAFT_576719 [Colletotrichum somersetense]